MQVLIVGSVQFIDAFGKLIIIAITAKPSSWGVVYHLQILKLCLCTMFIRYCDLNFPCPCMSR